MSLRARIAWIVALTVTVLLVAVGAAVQVVTASTLVAAVDEDLRAIAASIERDPRGLVVLAPAGTVSVARPASCRSSTSEASCRCHAEE